MAPVLLAEASYIPQTLSQQLFRSITAIQKYRIRWMLIIAVLWTLLDVCSKILFTATGRTPSRIVRLITAESITLRSLVVFCVSAFVSYLLVFRFRGMFRTYSPRRAFFSKLLILIALAMIGNLLIHTTYTLIILHYSPVQSLMAFYHDSVTTTYLLERTISWLITFALTLLIIEVNEKYSPGLFFSIIFGSYVNPRVERRIVMFLDLKDSTPIAESLGTARYFTFIRDFIYYISSALLEQGASIYQYVGDEVVSSWPSSQKNAVRCMKALAAARLYIEKSRAEFQKKYGVLPEFRVGIHEGEVTVGEIGIVKKDLAMSGDTMNTAARIRSATAETGEEILASQAFVELLNDETLGSSISIGKMELKGKALGLELFSYSV